MIGTKYMNPNPQEPSVTDALITYLEWAYPNRLPDSNVGEFGFGKLFGASQVVNHLKFLRDKQRENMLGEQLRLKEI